MKRIVLHIDRLVLNGFRHDDRQGIAEGLQLELKRMFADPQLSGQLTGMGNIPKLRAGALTITPGAKPQRVGMQVAQRIGKGIKP